MKGLPNGWSSASSKVGTLLLGSLLGIAILGLPACSGGQKGDPNNRGPFTLGLATTGSGQIYPYRITKLDSKGRATTEIINITKMDDLRDNVKGSNRVLPVATWSTTATLPNGNPGNQYLLLSFSHDLDPSSILSSDQADQGNSGLKGSIQVLSYDPATEATSMVKGRAFVGGFTYYDDLSTPGLDLTLVRAVKADKDGNVSVLDSRATGFPMGFTQDEDLVNKKAFVFVPDSDGDLSTFETFPAGKVIQIKVTSATLDYRGKPLTLEVNTATTVGADSIAPEVLGVKKGKPEISPGGGQVDVDPTTTISVKFSKPVHPADVGTFFSTTNKVPASKGITINMTQANTVSPVIYYADPLTPGNLMDYTIKPAYILPDLLPFTILVNNTINGLNSVAVGTTASTTFSTGEGPGFVNAPVAPQAIYVGRGGSSTGVSIIDLNGFGQGTGDPATSHFPKNPNVGAPGVIPNLVPGKTKLDGGGEGALTLTKSSRLKDLLIDSGLVSEVGDIQLGQPLDKIFNNENINPFATRANQVNPFTRSPQNAWGNSISVAPHPNPPKLRFPPPNPARAIFGEEPTVANLGGPGCQVQGPTNRLLKGNPFSDGPDKGVFHTNFQGSFFGPNPAPGSPQPPILFCAYACRQQIGHFLYVLDRGKRRILVLNSNRMTLIETIPVPDPVSMAVSPNLKRLAISNFSANSVTFVDIDPGSRTFHQIVHEEKVGRGPTGLAWQPEGEDLLVCNSLGDSLSIINGSDLKLRKSVIGQMNGPMEVSVSIRQVGVGFNSGIYFAFVLNRDGRVSVYESGPDGINGVGFDQIIGVPEQANFRNATTLQPDPRSAVSACWVAHQDSQGNARISHLELTSSPTGPQPIDASSGGFTLPPTFRQKVWTITSSLGNPDQEKQKLNGKDIVDIAMDDMNNFGAYPDAQSTFVSNLVYADHSGKGHFKNINGQLVPAVTPRFMFVGLGDSGRVDVIEIDSGNVVRSIPVSGVRVLASYWRQ